jgi:hypothetical protein
MIEDGTLLDCGHEKNGEIGYVKSSSGAMICAPCNYERRVNAYRPKVLRRERRDLGNCIGGTTLVGHIRMKDERPPYKHGNCCDILNMYTENAEALIASMPDVTADCEVEIVDLHGRERVRVVDSRIPDGYKYHMCSVCGIYEDGVIPSAPQEDMPEPVSGVQIVEFKSEPRKLKSTWSMEEPDDEH